MVKARDGVQSSKRIQVLFFLRVSLNLPRKIQKVQTLNWLRASPRRFILPPYRGEDAVPGFEKEFYHLGCLVLWSLAWETSPLFVRILPEFWGESSTLDLLGNSWIFSGQWRLSLRKMGMPSLRAESMMR